MQPPEFYPVPQLRQVPTNLPPTLRDVESRMPANHQYRHNDLATWVHETTHGLNARIRNEYRAKNGYPKINAFYCLNGRAVILPEPEFTIRRVAEVVPQFVRGRLFSNYLVSQQRWWNDRPLYLCDEWISYYADALVSRELGKTPHTGALEFSAYCLWVAQLAGVSKSTVQLWKFTTWNWQRVQAVYNQTSLAVGEAGPDYRRHDLRPKDVGE